MGSSRLGGSATTWQFWFESMQNWQSEFVLFAVAAIVDLSIFLWQRAAPRESKPGAEPHRHTSAWPPSWSALRVRPLVTRSDQCVAGTQKAGLLESADRSQRPKGMTRLKKMPASNAPRAS
jgi:hypothetical protein